MFDEGSAMKAEQGAACDVERLGEWFACWDTLEALARDADRLYSKCGASCSVEDLRQWRERVMAQVKTELENEERIFQALSQPEEEQQLPPTAALGSAA